MRFSLKQAAAAAKSLQSCLTLCDPIDGSPPGSTIPGILQARVLEWGAIAFSNSGKVKTESEVAQSCPTLSDPMDCRLPGSSVHGIFQARVLEWGAIAFSRLSLNNRQWTHLDNFTEMFIFSMIYRSVEIFRRRFILVTLMSIVITKCKH